MHLDAAAFCVPARFVRERRQVEVRIEFAVDACEEIFVEGGGHSCRIIIGRQQNGFGLHHIRADDQHGVLAQQRAYGCQQGRPFLVGEISDRRTREEAYARPVCYFIR